MYAAGCLRRVSLCSHSQTTLTRTRLPGRDITRFSIIRHAASTAHLQRRPQEEPVDVEEQSPEASRYGTSPSKAQSHENIRSSDPGELVQDPDAWMAQGLQAIQTTQTMSPRERRRQLLGKPLPHSSNWYEPESSPSKYDGSPFRREDYLEHPLQQIPEKPKYPCPHLSDEEVETYLFPLYARLWSITQCDIEWNGALRKPLMLSKTMVFPSFTAAMGFAKDLVHKIEAEEHHPRLTIDNNRVTVSTHTHSAIIPGISPDDKTSPYRKFPGVTLRDVRLAIEIELIYERHIFMDSSIAAVAIPSGRYPASLHDISGYRIPSPTSSYPGEEDDAVPSEVEHGLATVPLHTFVDAAQSHISELPLDTGKWEYRVWAGEVIEKPLGKLKCQACGGKHALPNCPVRHTIPPPGPCTLCDGDHWLVDCMLYERGKPKKSIW
ncbi:unnamed protein product [Somion occarium]|uniref:4a-hydroxytetrahydrobiopterin dehydratase n=1 Tax=Somion occarium TaxID=3059160 RepID=A0ABP1DIZ5_9APHY